MATNYDNKAGRGAPNQIAYAFEVKSLAQDGTFGGYASVFNVVDSQQDIVAPGAFRKSLATREQPVQLLWQHQWESPIGIIESLFEDARGLFIKGRLLMDVAQAREAYALLKAGVLRGMSIGYSVRKSTRNATTGVRTLLELNLFEVSLVTFPANEAARVTVVKTARGDISRLLNAIDHAGSALLN